MEIAILLSTYNSSKYLTQQLDSLLSQSYSNFKLYIRDDGSSDNTLEIVRGYCSGHSNIVILADAQKNRGAMGSFAWMLESVEADYYMFCDHDDVWKTTKVCDSLNKIREIEKDDLPAVVCSDLTVVDSDLKPISSSMWSFMRQRPELLIQKRYAISTNLFTGCTMIINRRAKMVASPFSDKALMHDSWIALRVMASGGILGYIHRPLILYRQHGNNVIGASRVGGIGYITSRLNGLNNMLKQWKLSYSAAKEAFNGDVSPAYYLFWKVVYLIKRG